MFEKEIKFIYDFNLNKVNKLGPYFTFEQLQSVEIHPAILQYISAEIDYLVFEDRQNLLKNSVFDYSGEKIVYHFNEITNELKKIKRFSLEYVAKIILHATSFTVNYLIRPNWTLTRFIFDESKHKTSSEIKQILHYVYYYKYLRQIITAYINSKKILSMSLDEFESLLIKTDKLGLETNLKGILSNSFISMAEFLNIGQMQKTRIPLSAVELFLEEKDLPHHLKKLNETLGNDENARFNIGDYMNVLTKVMIVEKSEMPVQQELLFDEQKEAEFDVVEPKVNEENNEDETLTESELMFGQFEQPVENLVDEDEIQESTIDLEKIEEPVDLDEESVLDDKIESETEEVTEIFSTDETLKITPNTKIKIKVNEDNKIEQLSKDDIDELEAQETAEEELNEEEIDSYSSLMEDLKSDVEVSEEIPEEDRDLLTRLEDTNSDEITEETKEEEEFEEEDEKANEEQLEFYGEANEEDEEIIEQEKVDLGEREEFIESESDEVKDEIVQNEQSVSKQSKLDISEVLEHKNMSRIIEVVFDYDIEDFANVLDEISNCRNVDDAHFVINEVLAERKIGRNTKEAETLREIITEYFSRK